MCEQKQITGTFLSGIRRDGRIDVAVLVEMGVGKPIACNSPASRRPRSFCFAVDGQVGEAGSDWVSITT